MKEKIAQILRRLCCLVTGHPCRPTGRKAILLTEWKCHRCKGIYVSHAHHGRILADSDEDCDKIFRDFADAVEAHKVLPNEDAGRKS